MYNKGVYPIAIKLPYSILDLLTTSVPQVLPKIFTIVLTRSRILSNGNRMLIADNGILAILKIVTKLTILVSGIPPTAIPVRIHAAASKSCCTKSG